MHVYIIDYYSAIKNEMSFAATCFDTEMIIPSEISQKEEYHVSLICGI